MKKYNILFFLILPMVINNFTYSQNSVEGLFYLDRTPVRIEYIDGKISGIIRLDRLPEGQEGIYVAPGLIDNQVNGYNIGTGSVTTMAKAGAE